MSARTCVLPPNQSVCSSKLIQADSPLMGADGINSVDKLRAMVKPTISSVALDTPSACKASLGANFLVDS